MKLISSIFSICFLVLLPLNSQTDIKYTETIKEVQEYMLNNDYTESMFSLKKLEKEGYNNANMNYLLGICCLNSLTDKALAVDYLKKATGSLSQYYNSEDPAELRSPAESMLYLGDAYLVNNKIKEARQCYIKYMNLSYVSEGKKDIARMRLKNCLFARLQMDHPLRIQLENAGKLINSGLANSNACISADGKKMVFLRTMKFYDALFYTVKSDTGWTEPINITTQVGSDGEYVPTALSPDGNRLLLKSFIETNGYEIFESVFNGKRWSKVKRLAEPVNSKFHDIDASYAEEGNSIYFSSNRIGGSGGYDLYKAVPDAQNQLFTISNLGNTINTVGNEKSPSVIESGKVLIFSTDFRNSIGGYDYYYSQLVTENNWSEPLNVGYPVNSTSNDYDLRFSSTVPRTGILSRFSDNNITSNDIYYFTCPVFSTLKLVPLTGKVKINDSSYNDITLALVDVAQKDTATVLSPNEDGSYFAELYPGEFDLIVKKNGKIESTSTFSIPQNFNEESFPLETEIAQNKTELNELKSDTLFVKDVLFEFNQWQISFNEQKILNGILEQIKKFPVKSIKLIGYSDAIGPEQYNLLLSERRAKSVKDFIIGHGIVVSEIVSEGQGAKNFVAPNTRKGGWDNPVGRALNRRVEMVIQFEKDTIIILKQRR